MSTTETTEFEASRREFKISSGVLLLFLRRRFLVGLFFLCLFGVLLGSVLRGRSAQFIHENGLGVLADLLEIPGTNINNMILTSLNLKYNLSYPY